MRVFRLAVVNRIPKRPLGKARHGGRPITRRQTEAQGAPLLEEICLLTQTPSLWTNAD